MHVDVCLWCCVCIVRGERERERERERNWHLISSGVSKNKQIVICKVTSLLNLIWVMLAWCESAEMIHTPVITMFLPPGTILKFPLVQQRHLHSIWNQKAFDPKTLSHWKYTQVPYFIKLLMRIRITLLQLINATARTQPICLLCGKLCYGIVIFIWEVYTCHVTTEMEWSQCCLNNAIRAVRQRLIAAKGIGLKVSSQDARHTAPSWLASTGASLPAAV